MLFASHLLLHSSVMFAETLRLFTGCADDGANFARGGEAVDRITTTQLQCVIPSPEERP